NKTARFAIRNLYTEGMARTEEDREDLMREATALVRRGEYAVPQEVEPVTLGFRKGGALSLFFGQDPVYQFNDAGQFRRGYVDGQLYKADNHRLTRLSRQRETQRTVLVSTPLSEIEQAELIVRIEWRLSLLAESIDEGEAVCSAAVPADADVAAEFSTWWRQVQMKIEIAAAPNVASPPQ
ncbi:MAG: hypothetical protein ACIALR_01515, partial [Blastopirellula sp. JB062]